MKSVVSSVTRKVFNNDLCKSLTRTNFDPGSYYNFMIVIFMPYEEKKESIP